MRDGLASVIRACARRPLNVATDRPIDEHKNAYTNRERGSFMSFKAVWGFDPEEIEKAKRVADDDPGELGVERPDEDFVSDGWERIPSGVEAQIYELLRMFRLWR